MKCLEVALSIGFRERLVDWNKTIILLSLPSSLSSSSTEIVISITACVYRAGGVTWGVIVLITRPDCAISQYFMTTMTMMTMTTRAECIILTHSLVVIACQYRHEWYIAKTGFFGQHFRCRKYWCTFTQSVPKSTEFGEITRPLGLLRR